MIDKKEVSYLVIIVLLATALFFILFITSNRDVYPTTNCRCRSGYVCEQNLFSFNVCVKNNVQYAAEEKLVNSSCFSGIYNKSAEQYNLLNTKCTNISTMLDSCYKEKEDLNKTLEQTKLYGASLQDEMNNYVSNNVDYLNMREEIVTVKEDNPHTSIEICPGCKYFLYCTGSMQPTINCFSHVYLYEADKNDLKPGDIIAFKTEEFGDNFSFIIHRIVEVDGNNYYTKGDANTIRDQNTITYRDIIGKVWKIEYGQEGETVLP